MKKNNPISRRKFLDIGVQGYAGIQLAGALPLSMMAASSCKTNGEKLFHGVCYHDCPDSCSWQVKVVDDEIVSFGASPNNPWTKGSLCNKMETFPQDVTYHPDRLLTPLRRTGPKGSGEFEPVSWDVAIEEVAVKLKAIITENGSESVLPFGYAGTQGVIQNSTMSRRFFTKMGASKLDGTICGATAATGNSLVNGQTMGILPEDIVHSRYIILWGTNTMVSNVHLWPFVEEARKSGAKIIVIDPFKTKTAQAADWHIQPKPGTDVALALGMVNVIISENLTDADYIRDYCLGFEELKEHAANYNPANVAEICGLPEEDIFRLAREYAAGQPSLIRFLIGMEHNSNGGDAFRAIALLPSLIGAWRQHGGGLLHMTYEMFGESLNWQRVGLSDSMEVKEVRSINMVQLGRALNDPELNPAIKALFIFNSNPAVTIPDQNAVCKGLSREDLLTISIEHFMTDSAKYADYIFPATTQLEHWDVADSWGQVYVGLNQPAIKPRGEAKPNNEFFRLLGKAMDYESDLFDETDLEIARSIFDKEHPFTEGVDFEYMQKHGWVRLKIPEPWMPHANGGFGTASGKCEFYAASLESEGSALPQYKTLDFNAEETNNYPLQLLTIKSTFGFHNSSHANVEHLIKAEGDQWLSINPLDANQRSIQDGDPVKAFNGKGEVLLRARIDKNIRPGLLAMPQGHWSSKVKGNSTANALTNDRLADLGGGSAFHDCRVEVVKA